MAIGSLGECMCDHLYLKLWIGKIFGVETGGSSVGKQTELVAKKKTVAAYSSMTTY